MRRISFAVLLCLAACIRAEGEPASFLRTHCHSCHGRDGSLEGGMNYILDIERLVAKRLIVPGKPDESPLLKRIEKGEMPPSDSPKPSPVAIKAFRDWIAAGAKTDVAPSRQRVSSQTESQWIYDDLRRIDPRSRRFARYFRFTPLWNAGASADELATYRNALAKVLNSLSWHPTLTAPELVGPNGLIFRIDLRWYQWDATLWNRLANEYPYGIQTERTIDKVISSFTATRLPVVNGDWFIATATRPPLYQDLLQLPVALAELERQLRVDAAVNIQQERVTRLAFNGSGISRNNRVLERHDSVHGYYWRTYDFEEVPQNLGERGLLQPDRRNVFAYPLGPGSLENQFQHAGGEAIFRLPNGMQGYFIMNAANNRLDKAPVAIVSDPKRPDRAVELGVSCMGCHVTGILPKLDQMHDHLEKNAAAFPKGERELASALYPAKEKTLAKMEADSKRYLAALADLGVPRTKAEPVIALTQRYEADLTATQAAAELGLSYDDFRQRLSKATNLKRNVGALAVPGGAIARQVWVQGFGDLVESLGLGTLFQANRDTGRLPDNTGDIDPLESISGAANAMAFSADGRTAYLASGDRSLKALETEAKRDLKRYIGHTASVWSIALSPNGKWLASGSADRTVRIWNVETGVETKRLIGHEATVAFVAFADNGRVVSASLDGALIVWDWKDSVDPAKEWKLPDFVGAMAVSADNGRIAVGSGKRIHVYDAKELKLLKAWDAHDSPVSALAFGDALLSADNDGAIRRWNPAWRKTGDWKTEHNGITRLAANDDWFATTGSDRRVRLWKKDGKNSAKTFGPMSEPVVALHFAGKQLIGGTRGGAFKIWGLD